MLTLLGDERVHASGGGTRGGRGPAQPLSSQGQLLLELRGQWEVSQDVSISWFTSLEGPCKMLKSG